MSLCLLQFSKAFKGLPQDRIEEAFDRFAREEFRQGQQIVKEGEPVSKMYIVKMGELVCTRGGQPVTAIQEAGGFSYFGEQAVLVSKQSLRYLCCSPLYVHVPLQVWKKLLVHWTSILAMLSKLASHT